MVGSSAPQGQPQAGQAGQGAQTGQATSDVQAQWAEYYRSLGYAYYGQQGGSPAQAPAQGPSQAQPPPQPAAQPPVTSANGEQKVKYMSAIILSRILKFRHLCCIISIPVNCILLMYIANILISVDCIMFRTLSPSI